MRRECSYPLLRKALMVTVLCVMSTLAAQAEVVNFPDKNLEAAIRKAIHKPTGDILDTDLVGTDFTELEASHAGIADLSGLEYCTDLTDLYLGQIHLRNGDVDGRLHENQISDIVALAGLTNLKWLVLESNHISDISVLAGLTNLEELNLEQNQISDISALACLTKLKYLFLGANQISDISALAGLINLHNLRLTDNKISDLRVLARLTDLGNLDLSNNQISDLSAVARLSGLVWLFLDSNQISDIGALADLTNLQRLYLNGNLISDISVLAGLRNLIELHLSSNQISDVTALAGLTRLSFDLDLAHNQINDVSPLAGLAKLIQIHLSSNQISDVSVLASLPELGYMSLKGNPIRGIKSWITIAKIKWRRIREPLGLLVLAAGLVLLAVGLVLVTGLVLLRLVTRRVSKRKKSDIRWGLKDWRGVPKVAMMVGGTGIAFGLASPTAESIVAQLAVIGFVIFAIGLLAYAVTSIMIRRAKR